MNTQATFLSPIETARRLGVSVRALRLYERRGLVRPGRTLAGWRAYGPNEIERLHQVLALKGLGLSLAAIAELILDREAGLDAVLAVQEQALSARRGEIDRALQAIRAARGRLAKGEHLSLDDLTHLNRETQMTQRMKDAAWREAFEPVLRKHFSAEEYERMAAHKVKIFAARGYDAESFGKAWDAVVADASAAMAAGDKTSPEAREVLRRWVGLSDIFTGAEADLNDKAVAAWRETMNDPDRALKLPISRELWEFMVEVARLAKAA